MSAYEPIIDSETVDSELAKINRRLQASNRKLAQANRALLENEARLQMILHRAPFMIVSRNHQGHYQLWSHECERQLGVSLSDVNNGSDPFRLFYSDPDLRDRISQDMQRGDGQFRDYSTQKASGKSQIHRWACMRLPSGESIAVGCDVTKAREKQAQLELAVKELGRRNEALDNFATAACHDLQEPLRMVSGYVRLLLDECDGQLGEEAKRFIEFAAEGAERMTQMIRGLLSLARVGNHDVSALEELDVRDVVGEAIANLGAAIDSRNAEIQVENLPRLRTIHPLLVQIFLNLIGNAIKFCRHSPPQIRIDARRSHEEWVFRVKDNGIGIDLKNQKKIFHVFQRINRQGFDPGAGVGLALVKRSVESLGGRIWLESKLGVGTTFFFTLPERPKTLEEDAASSPTV